MKTTLLSALALAAATPAFAHPGTHMHIHGVEPMLVIGVTAALIYALAEVLKARGR